MANNNQQININGHIVRLATETEIRPGYSPYIGENGNWYVYDMTVKNFVDTGVPAQSGRAIESIEKTGTSGNIDTYTITFTDGTTTTFQITNADTSAIEELAEDVADLNTALSQKADIIITSASGDIASFADGADNLPVEDLTVGIEPVQDLHGYDHPWAPGGGKNLLEVTASSDTKNEVTFTVNDDGTISVSGTANALTVFTVGEYTATATEYVVFNGISGGSINTYSINCAKNGQYTSDVFGGDSENISLSANDVFRYVIVVRKGATVSFVCKPMIRLAPYSNICPISGFTDMTVMRTGFNVWDEEWEAGGINDTTGASEPAFNNSQGRSKNYIPVLPGKTYFIRVGDVGDTDYAPDTKPQIWAYAYDANKNFIGRIYRDGTTSPRIKNAAVTMPQGCCFIRFKWWYSSAAVFETYNHDISINYPASDTGYHPYSGTSIPIDWTTEAGTVYGGSLDVTTGVLTVDRKYINLTQYASRVEQGSGNVYFNYYGSSDDPQYGCVMPIDVSKSLSSHFKALSVTTDAEASFSVSDWGGMGFRGVPGVTDTVAHFTAFLEEQANNGTPVTIVMALATPQTYQLTPQEVVKTLLGRNNIWANTGDCSVTYRADTKLYVDGKVDGVRQDLSLIAPIENGTTASQAYTAGQYFLKGDKFCKALTSIASGATFTLNTNYAVTTVAAELYTALNS